MNGVLHRSTAVQWEDHLLGLSSFVAVVSLACIPSTPGPKVFRVPEVIVPLGISLGLSLYTIRLKRQDSAYAQLEPMVKYGWAGAVVSAAIGGSWMALHLHYGLPIDVLPDKILTVLSVGIAAGVLVGRSANFDHDDGAATDRSQVLAETSWTNRPGETPIFDATVEALSDVEGVDPLELDPLYEHVDPEVFADLRARDGSRWGFTFHVDEHAVHVTSCGTVTVFPSDYALAG